MSTAGLAVASLCGLVVRNSPVRLAHIGYLASMHSNDVQYAAFAQRLNELGWIDGQNLSIEWRYTDGDDSRASAIAAEFVNRHVDVIIAGSHLC